ncbi:MAG: tetratricopeptide repeat protein [Vicingaceae bacterium]
MSKKTEQNDETIVDVAEVYSKTETYIEENKNTLTTVVAVIAIVVGGYFAYSNFYLKPLQEEAQKEMFMAEKYFAQDSLNLAIYGDDAYPGFLEIADKYSGTKSGNLASYYLGLSYLKTGQYEAAIDALEDFDGSDVILEATKLGAIGDAYMELGDLNKAVSYYEDAASANKNEFSSPLFLMKAGKTYELLGNYASAIEVYEKIKTKYQSSAQASEVAKYIARAEAYVN